MGLAESLGEQDTGWLCAGLETISRPQHREFLLGGDSSTPLLPALGLSWEYPCPWHSPDPERGPPRRERSPSCGGSGVQDTLSGDFACVGGRQSWSRPRDSEVHVHVLWISVSGACSLHSRTTEVADSGRQAIWWNLEHGDTNRGRGGCHIPMVLCFS